MIVGVVIGAVVLAGLILFGYSVKIVREYQRVLLFRLGRAIGLRGPGLVLINPVTDRTAWIDLRELFLEIPHQTAITKDNATISIDFIIFYKVVDPAASVLQVQNFAVAAQNVAATSLRSVVGDMPLDDILSKREDMNAALRIRLDEVTERWGVKVTTVEVREVNPPAGVLEAMTRQMSAERTRRAAITEAEGKKQSAITMAEGTKQAAILAAEGERRATTLRAEGLASGLERMYAVGKGLDRNTMQLQYLEVMKQVGAGASTKIVVPMDLLSGFLRSLPGGADAQAVADGLPLQVEGRPPVAATAGADGAPGEGVPADGAPGEAAPVAGPGVPGAGVPVDGAAVGEVPPLEDVPSDEDVPPVSVTANGAAAEPEAPGAGAAGETSAD